MYKIQRNSKRITIAAILFFFTAALSLFALEVNSDELSRGKYGDISFTNYGGPHDEIDTVEEIIGIGEYLGNQLLLEDQERGDYRGKYRVIRVVSPEIESGLDADIFIILPTAEVDHIDNLRRMIAGYFMSYYKYNREDSLLLAEFVTLYNAAYRQDMGFFRERYKDPVINELEPDKAGLSTRYDEWPGQSMLLIPLTKQARSEGDLGSLDSDELTEEKVEEDLQSREDKGVESRKEMVELKEREVQKEKEDLEEEKEEIAEEEKEVVEKEEQIQKKEEEIEQKEKEIAEKKEELEEEKQQVEESGTEEEKKELAKKEEELKEDEEQLKKEKEKVEEEKEEAEKQKEEVEEKKEEVQEREEKVEEREKDIKEDREEIAKDTKETLEKEEEIEESRKEEAINSEEAEYIYFLVLREEEGEPMGKFVLLNTVTGDIASTSRVTTIQNRRFDVFEDNLLVVASEGSSNLFLINPNNLKVEVKSDTEVFKESSVLINGPNIYAVVEDGSNWKIGKFNGNLELTATSSIAVTPYTVILFNKNRLFVQKDYGGIVTLSPADLTYTE